MTLAYTMVILYERPYRCSRDDALHVTLMMTLVLLMLAAYIHANDAVFSFLLLLVLTTSICLALFKRASQYRATIPA